jgi:pyruvate/2-oxoglutarate dehydrogenase complex dihydrolipoamide acyltransferase (E2) component
MEIPTPVTGKVIDINVTLGDKIKLGDLILNLTEGKKRYVELLDDALKKELQENFQNHKNILVHLLSHSFLQPL